MSVQLLIQLLNPVNQHFIPRMFPLRLQTSIIVLSSEISNLTWKGESSLSSLYQ